MQSSIIYVLVVYIHIWKFIFAANPVINNLPDAVDLHEETSTEILVFSIDVTDADGDSITCSLGTGNLGFISTSFNVRNIPGSTDWGVYTEANANYDYTSRPLYIIIIQCDDSGGNSDQKTLTVNILENQAPVINNLPGGTVSLSATSSGIGDTVFKVNATDADGDQITFSISCNPATPQCPFDVFSSGDILLNADISSITVIGYDVTVSVSDDKGNNGVSQTLTVTFTDLNTQPSIQNLGTTISVPENGALDDTLETTMCTDADVTDTLSYSMTCTPSSGLTYFQIDSTTGVISTSSSSINYEFLLAAGDTSFACVVTCSDSKNSDTASIAFDVTNVNEAPRFSQNGYSISTNEGITGTALQATGYDITDEDSGDSETFSFDCGTSTGYFLIDSATGILSFGSDYDVDDGVRPTSVSCTLTVTDGGGMSQTVTLLITISNINDNSPIFSPISYSWFISEGDSVGTTVGTVSANDADIGTYGNISYSLDQSALGANYFGIDQDGTVFILNSVAPLGSGVTVSFDAIATDGGGTETRADISIITVATTTVTTTTTTDRYKTFLDDGRNIAWLTATGIILLATFIIITWMCCTFSSGISPAKRRFNFKCCKLWTESHKKRVQIEEPKVEEPEEVKPETPVIIEKPKPEPQGFNFWGTSENQWS